MKLIVIVMPIYKLDFEMYEYATIINNIQCMSNRDICIICPDDIDEARLNIFLHKANVKNIRIEKLNKDNFTSKASYNRMCLKKSFYQMFDEYEYMLICQSDAWIFRDDLDFWCNKKYDYVGAPWCHQCSKNLNCDYNSKPINNQLNVIGNGGLSLRRVKKFIEAATILENDNSLDHINLENEDVLFMNRSDIKWNLPKCREALNFSVESLAKTHMKNGIHPMGYHNIRRITPYILPQLHFVEQIYTLSRQIKQTQKMIKLKHMSMRSNENSQNDLNYLINSFSASNLTLIEIGSYMGESSCIFANSKKFNTIICIDPWQNGKNPDNLNSYAKMDIVEKMFDENTKDFSCIQKYKGTIDTFIQSNLFKRLDGKIDIVYIDGLHTYDGCKHDIDICQKVVKPRLAYAGHDYTDKILHVVGVKKAVDEMLGKPDNVFCDNSWIKFV